MAQNEAAKGAVEIRVFERFAQLRGLEIVAGSVQKRVPPEPDILCRIVSEGSLGFEITEACAPEFAAAESRALREGVAFAWGGDVSVKTIRNKLAKCYSAPYPVELIVYAGRTALPDDVIVPTVKPVLANGTGPFRRVWFLGDELFELSANEG